MLVNTGVVQAEFCNFNKSYQITYNVCSNWVGNLHVDFLIVWVVLEIPNTFMVYSLPETATLACGFQVFNLEISPGRANFQTCIFIHLLTK